MLSATVCSWSSPDAGAYNAAKPHLTLGSASDRTILA